MFNKRKTFPKKLLVEGDEDLRTIPYLIEENGIGWGKKGSEIVNIISADGIEKLIEIDFINTHIKEPNLTIIGIMIDADESAPKRWSQLRNTCSNFYDNLPEILPENGLIHQEPDKPKLGVWLMPDNKLCGMLETFLTYLIRNEDNPILTHAKASRDIAKKLGAKYKDAHSDKAAIHTWLAWQDPPGRQLHNAVMEQILNPSSDRAQVFVKWFRDLFEI
jgi:hypothetical protein